MSDLSDQAEVLRQLQARLAQLEAGQQRRAATHGAVLDALPAHVAMLDAQGVIVSVNRAWQEFAAANGGTASDIGKDYAALCDGAVGGHAEEAARAARCIRSVLGRPGAQDAFEYPCHSPTEQRWFRMTATALPPDLDGAAADGVMVMHISVTERRHAELRQERERMLLRTLIDALPDAVYSMDADARGVICNPAAARAFGVAVVEDLVGKTALDVLAPVVAAHRYAEDLQVLSGHAVSTYEVRDSDHEGRPAWSLVTKLALRDTQGKIVGLVGIHRDISEQKRAQAQAEALSAQLGTALDRLGVEHAQLREAQAIAKIGNWVVDLATGSELWSDEMHCILMTDPKRTVPSYQSYLERVDPADRAAVCEFFTGSQVQSLGGRREDRLSLPGGVTKVIEACWQADCDAQGRPLRVLGTCQDITERRQSEQHLRELAARLSDTVESITDNFYTVDRDWRFTHANSHLLALLSKPRSEVVGAVLWDVSPHLAGTPFEEAFRRAMRDGVAVNVEAWLPGRQRWYSSRAYPSEAGLTVQFRDVSAEHAARRHLELLEASISQLSDLVAVADNGRQDRRGLRVIFVNEAFVRATGHCRDDVVGRSASLLYGPLTDRAEIERMRQAGERRQAVRAELQVYRKDGETFWAEVDVVPVQVRGESPEHFVIIARDITERRHDRQVLRELNAGLEARVAARTAELSMAREQAESANRAKSAFLATMSHEIRTPMNGVMGMIDVLHQTSLKGYQVEMVDLIRDSADSLMAIIDDILDFSKIEAGKLQIQHEPMRLADAVEKVCAMLDHTAVKRGVRMAVFVDPAIPRVLAGDETRVRQVLVNLCGNAIKFSSGQGRQGETSVRATMRAQDDQGVDIEIAVADNGIGMDEAAVSRLFTPFSQADGSTTRRFGGTGLGLAITSTLVRLMGGEIVVRSSPGQGSAFTVRLRLARVANALNDGPVGPVGSVGAAGLRCRIIGGEQPLAHDLGAYLAHAGAVVEPLPNLAAAVAAPVPAGLCVWLILPGQDVPDLAALRAMAPGAGPGPHGPPGPDEGSETRFVVLGRGARRRLRVEAADLVSLDADALLRSTLIKALALAAGRVPKAPVNDAADAACDPAQAPPRHEARAQGRLILVAEDNETNRLVIVRQLALIGCAADVAVNGREALESWRSGDYALLLTDLHMPEMDGYALASAIRAEEAGGRRTPIVALTANALRDEARLCLDAGMDAYLTKPIRLAPLRQAIEHWLVPQTAPTAPGVSAVAPLPVNMKVLVDLVGDDPVALRGVLQAFRASATQLAGELEAAATVATALPQRALTSIAHQLKSGARAIGADTLAELCAAVEQAGPAEAMNVLLPRLRVELQTVQEHLSRREGSP